MSSLRSWVAVAGLLSLLCIPSASSAADPTGGWIERTTITRLVVHDWGRSVMVFFATPQGAAAKCVDATTGRINNDFVVIPATHPLFKELYSTALAASMSGMTVGGFVWSCDSDFNRPQLLRIELLPNPNVAYP